jgi:epsilon-lactone hydrolase
MTMTGSGSVPTVHVPARDIPVPTSVSKEAQAFLALGVIGPPTEWPELDDVNGWRTTIAAAEEVILTTILGREPTAANAAADVDEVDIDGVRVYVITPDGTPPDDRRVYLEFHGGGFIYCAGAICRSTAIDTANYVGARVWSVDYRMPPDHAYPAALDDCITAYRALLNERLPEEIIVGGVSAGGNLAAATILRARDEGLPMPAAAVLMTPGVDLTASGDTWHTNLGLDAVLTGSYTTPFQLYAAGHDLSDPYLSPLYGDFTKGFPPTILTSGTRDLLLSDTVRMHRALHTAGVPTELHVWEAAGHSMFFGRAPEDTERNREVRRFMHEHWTGVDRP